MTPEQEAKARAILERAKEPAAVQAPAALEKSRKPVAVASTPPAVAPDSAAELKSKRELIKEQEKEGKKRRDAEKKLEQAAAKKRAEQEAKAKTEIERLDKEAKVKAREEARRKLEAEAKAREAKLRVPEPIAVRAPEPVAVRSPEPESVRAVPAAAFVTAPQPPVAIQKPATEVKPISVAPASASATSKKQRLDALTDSYVHNKVTAEQYHRERAKILADPSE
jgi:hypothetical protein